MPGGALTPDQAHDLLRFTNWIAPVHPPWQGLPGCDQAKDLEECPGAGAGPQGEHSRPEARTGIGNRSGTAAGSSPGHLAKPVRRRVSCTERALSPIFLGS